VFFRDYKVVNGLNIPHTLETAVEGVKQTRKIVVKSVAINPKLDDALFGKPQPGEAAAASQRASAL
jgi:hydroxylamine reductase (hybrid-cluster protein)